MKYHPSDAFDVFVYAVYVSGNYQSSSSSSSESLSPAVPLRAASAAASAPARPCVASDFVSDRDDTEVRELWSSTWGAN